MRNTTHHRPKKATRQAAQYFPNESKFSPNQIELAASIENDIAEDIDNGEGREDLRMAVHFWACEASNIQAKLMCKNSSEVVSELRKLNRNLDQLLSRSEASDTAST